MSVVALVGRPNVGKSTLFNRLTVARDALVLDQPGLTRDRQYGRATIDGHAVTLIDTGGLLGEENEISHIVSSQVDAAIAESDLIVFLVDARDGLTGADQEIALDLRKRGAEILLVANKIDGSVVEATIAEFSRLGFGAPLLISAQQNKGIGELRQRLVEISGPPELERSYPHSAPRIAVIGRPNVGKSTLVNRLIGDERVVVFDEPGTTRDSIRVPFERDGELYELIDTAGVRRRGRVTDVIEKFSVVKTLDAIEYSDVAFILVDARVGVVDQDLHVMSYAQDSGTGLVLVVNKSDGLSASQWDSVRASVDRKMRFAPWVPVMYISALQGRGVRRLFRVIHDVYSAGEFDVTTSELNQILQRAVNEHPPPNVGGRAIKLRYAHKAGSHPPRIVLHGNRTRDLPRSYLRYLENYYREALSLVGMPVRIELKTSINPFAGRKNELTRRQRQSRRRVIRHGKRY